MIRRRETPDGLPFRVYERYGKRVYSIGYKSASGHWLFRHQCDVMDKRQVAKLRKKAIIESANIKTETPLGTFPGLVNAWFAWQESVPENTQGKRKSSTMAEYRNEAKNLIHAWSSFEPAEITTKMGYDYLEACAEQGRPIKGNKEITLAKLILDYGIRKGLLPVNPLKDVKKNPSTQTRHRVTAEELALAVEMGRKLGGARLITALALKTAWLCVRRSVEVRALTRQAITDEGIVWQDGKDETKARILIEWSPELRATIDEVLSINRYHVAGTMYLFGNMRGTKYTKGGWKSGLHDLMTACEEEAKKRMMPFRKFSLQDCRPMGVSDKLEAGHTDTQEATLHQDGKMIARVYDRRQQKRAKPAA